MPLNKNLKWLLKDERAHDLVDMLPIFYAQLPKGVEFDSDTWDLLAWVRRRGNRRTANISFRKYKNAELKILVKIYILYKREATKIDRGVAELARRSMLALDQAIGEVRSPLKLNNGDFAEAQIWLEQNYQRGSPSRMSHSLQDFGAWLNAFLRLRITYKSSLKSYSYHGRKANQDERSRKLVPTEVIRDMVAAALREDLILKDRFFLSAFYIDVCCGFRINELTTLPVNCLFEEEGRTGIHFFPEKKGKLEIRWISESMVPAIKHSIQFIREITEPARCIALRKISSNAAYNWRFILTDENATRYFFAKFAHEWTSKPENNLFNKSGAWYEKKKIYVDVINVLANNDGNRSAASRELGIDRNTLCFLENAQLAVQSGKLPQTAKFKSERISWHRDSRVFSMERYIKATGVRLSKNRRRWVKDIADNAQSCQLAGTIYPAPCFRPDLEEKFSEICHPPLIVDKNGEAKLEAQDALFILQKYSFSSNFRTKLEEISYVADNSFARWLSGENRSRGTCNHEDSCFSRLGIIDPRTEEIATFDWHDIRHWLDTMYENGGLSEDMIALIFGRKTSSNHIYDQTDMNTRINRLRDSVRSGQVFGYLTETYSMLAKQSRDEAEAYLKAKTLMVNPMPHGMCTNNWSAMPCPHHLGCFAGNHQHSDGACENLEVEPQDKRSIQEIKRINREALIAIDVIPVQSPQHAHFLRVEKNSRELLNRLDKVSRDAEIINKPTHLR
jgi:hypothetical protein